MQHAENLKRIGELEKKGYTFEISCNGYMVRYHGIFLGGASVKLPRAKPLHWRHRKANIEQNVSTALLIADQAKCQTA